MKLKGKIYEQFKTPAMKRITLQVIADDTSIPKSTLSILMGVKNVTNPRSVGALRDDVKWALVNWLKGHFPEDLNRARTFKNLFEEMRELTRHISTRERH